MQDVIDRAGVSRPTFYEHFSNKEDCFLAAFDTSAERLRKKVDAAARKGGDVWRDRVRLGLEALLRFAMREPDTARMMVVEAGPPARPQLGGVSSCWTTSPSASIRQARELLPASRSQTPADRFRDRRRSRIAALFAPLQAGVRPARVPPALADVLRRSSLRGS